MVGDVGGDAPPCKPWWWRCTCTCTSVPREPGTCTAIELSATLVGLPCLSAASASVDPACTRLSSSRPLDERLRDASVRTFSMCNASCCAMSRCRPMLRSSAGFSTTPDSPLPKTLSISALNSSTSKSKVLSAEGSVWMNGGRPEDNERHPDAEERHASCETRLIASTLFMLGAVQRGVWDAVENGQTRGYTNGDLCCTYSILGPAVLIVLAVSHGGMILLTLLSSIPNNVQPFASHRRTIPPQ